MKAFTRSLNDTLTIPHRERSKFQDARLKRKSSSSRMDKASAKLTLVLERAAHLLEQGYADCAIGSDNNHAESSHHHNEAGVASPAQRDLNKLYRSLQRMADAVRRRECQQEQMIATAAHDLRTPLFLIGSAARMLRNPDTPREEWDDWLDCIIRQTTSLEVLVEDFHDGVCERAGRLELRREEIDLAQLAEEAVRDYGSVVQTHPLHFDGQNGCAIIGDGERLKRLLFNLLSNAAKYSEPGREITVGVWRHGERICLTVQDDGTGIPPSAAERLFLPYTRLDHAREVASGEGLGLTSVKRIADAHGAEINIQGAADRGTTFEICFRAKPEV